MKTIYDYASYREFLKDGYVREKGSSRRTTLALYARQFEMSAASLNMIFSGARNLTIDGIHEIASKLRLSKQEHEYFEALVLKDQSKKAVSVQRYYQQRLKSISKTVATRNVRVSDKEIVSDWLVPALLIYLVDFSTEAIDRPLIAKKFGIALEHLSALMGKLEKSGFLRIDSTHRVHVVLEKLLGDGPQKSYIKAVLGEVLQRVDSDFRRPDAIFRSFVFTVEKTAIPELRRDLISLFEKYMGQISEKTEENALVQSMVALFPVIN